MNHSEYEKIIHTVENYPKEGVSFKDITPLFYSCFTEMIEDMTKQTNMNEVDYVAGIDARGFILGSAIAEKFKKGFIPLRKKGKLPPPFLEEAYTLEYGESALTIKDIKLTGPKRVMIVDDVLATGGTLKAAIKLCQKMDFEIKSINVFVNLTFLNTFDQQYPFLKSVLQYNK